MENNNPGKIRIELWSHPDTSEQYKDYVESLHEYLMSDAMMHTKARLEVLETMIHILLDKYGCTPNQMKVIEKRRGMTGDPEIIIEVDQNITPVYVLVNGDKEPLKAPKSKEKEDVWYLGM